MTTETIKAQALAATTAQVRAELAANDHRFTVAVARVHAAAALIPLALAALNIGGVL
jgi:hypothetical protein